MTLSNKKAFKAAAVQASPVYYDLEASLQKAIKLVHEAASAGASLIVFPETYLPGYPFHIWLEPYGAWLGRTEAYYANCPTSDGPECKTLEALAKSLDITIVMGCSEKDHGTLYMSQWIIAPEGLIAQRRKLKPSLMERVVFGEGDGSDIRVHDSRLGRIGALNCWEHNVPLIKHVMACQHEEIHCASWPHLHDNMPHHSLGYSANTGSNRAYAIEVGTFVIMSTAPMSHANATHICGDDPVKRDMLGTGGGCSMIFDPEGREIAERLEHDKEGLVYATIDTGKCALAKSALDTVGHYARGDVFQVIFNGKPRQPLELLQGQGQQRPYRQSRAEIFGKVASVAGHAGSGRELELGENNFMGGL